MTTILSVTPDTFSLVDYTPFHDFSEQSAVGCATIAPCLSFEPDVSIKLCLFKRDREFLFPWHSYTSIEPLLKIWG